MMSKNLPTQCHIGQGYYPTITPLQIKRYILENPKFYTAYTPYQAEVSQGRLEMLHNFQILIQRLTGLSNANCSLLDETNAAIEAMLLAHRVHKKKYKHRDIFLLDKWCFDHVIQGIETTADQLDIKIVRVDWDVLTEQIISKVGVNCDKDQGFAEYVNIVSQLIKDSFNEFEGVEINEKFLKDRVFGALFQAPNSKGVASDFSFVNQFVKRTDLLSIYGTDLMYR